MIQIGQISNDEHAATFGAYLYSLGIECQVEQDSEGEWELWVIDSDNIKQARVHLEEYLNDPQGSKYMEASREGEAKKDQVEKEYEEYAKKVHTRSKVFAVSRFSLLSLTALLIFVSVGITFSGNLGRNGGAVYDPFRITEVWSYDDIVNKSYLPEVSDGQVWRLITPIFLHFGYPHIIFNMIWLQILGYMIEKKKGVIFLFLMVLILGLTSNIGQFLVAGSQFGGMSGVVYGLLGYIWIRTKIDPGCGLYISKDIVTMMLIWFLLCMLNLPFMPRIANTAHGVGLGVGMIWGFLEANISRALR